MSLPGRFTAEQLIKLKTVGGMRDSKCPFTVHDCSFKVKTKILLEKKKLDN